MIAAMVHKYVLAAEADDDRITHWGTGSPSREFLYVDDAARALVLAAERAETSAPFNVGNRVETRIRDLAENDSQVVLASKGRRLGFLAPGRPAEAFP